MMSRELSSQNSCPNFFAHTDSMALDEGDEVRGCVSRERGLREVRVGRDEVLRRRARIREVAAAAARNRNLTPGYFVMFEHDHAPPARARNRRAHQPGRAPAYDYNVRTHRSKLFVDIHNLREYLSRARARPL